MNEPARNVPPTHSGLVFRKLYERNKIRPSNEAVVRVGLSAADG